MLRRSPRTRADSSPGRKREAVAARSPKKAVPSPDRGEAFVAALAFVNGWGDVVSMQRFSCFLSKMSGNAIKMATAFGKEQWADAGFLTVVLLCYVLGIIFYGLSKQRQAPRGAGALVVALSFFAIDRLADASKWPALLLAFAWGIINALSSDAGNAITTMITGHLLTIGNSLTATLTSELTPAQRAGARRSAIVFSTFAGGVVLAAAGFLPSPRGMPQLPSFSCLGVSYAVLMLRAP